MDRLPLHSNPLSTEENSSHLVCRISHSVDFANSILLVQFNLFLYAQYFLQICCYEWNNSRIPRDGGDSLLCSTHDFHIVICKGFSNFHHDFYIPVNRNKEGGRRRPCIFKDMTYKLHITFSRFLLVKTWSHDTSR